MPDREKVIKTIEGCINDNSFCNKCDYDGCVFQHGSCEKDLLADAIALLKEQEAKPPVHIHEEYPEHDWVRDKNGNIDDFAYDGDYHNGPMCKRCHYAFCIYCDPDGWNKEPCIIDGYKCPKCGRYIVRRTKFCSDCGQAVKWNEID